LGRGDKNEALWNSTVSKHAHTYTDGTASPWVFFLQIILTVKAPRYLYTLAMSQVSYKEGAKTTMVTKNLTSKFGLSRYCT
jgi:hypothetical protein